MYYFWLGLMYDVWVDIRVFGQLGKEIRNLNCYIYVVGYIMYLVLLIIVGMSNEMLIFVIV